MSKQKSAEKLVGLDGAADQIDRVVPFYMININTSNI